MDRWKDGRMERWRDGEMEGRMDGGMIGWCGIFGGGSGMVHGVELTAAGFRSGYGIFGINTERCPHN